MSLTLGALALSVSAASAQTNQEVNSAYQFNFSNPGARSLAMGGSLTGLADDATAALTNPSGLLLLPSTEASAELRWFGYSNFFTSGGNLGTPTGIGIDTVSGLSLVETDDSVTSPSFFSFTVPRPRYAVAGYYHELANFSTDIQTNGTFLASSAVIGGRITRLNPLSASLDLKVRNVGASAAFKLTEQVLLGGGLALSMLDMSSTNDRLCWSCRPVRFAGNQPLLDQPGELLGAPIVSRENVLWTQGQDSDDTAMSYNVGVTVMPNTHVGFGASYRRGAEFGVDIAGARGPAIEVLPLDTSTATTVPSEGTFKVPDVFAAGVVVRPPLGSSNNVLRLSAEIRRVTYSDLVKDFVVTNDAQEVSAADFEVDDGTELRIGGEYLIVGTTTFALRGGAWFDPDHRVRYTGSSQRVAPIFRRGEDEWHYTGGGGVTIKKFQVDFGFDVSERVTTTSGSLILRF